MINSLLEYMKQTEGRSVKCTSIIYRKEYAGAALELDLPVGYTPEELSLFLKELNFQYDNGYGGQELFGTIWYTDGTWSSRAEYDGSEWWVHNVVPKIPESLLK